MSKRIVTKPSNQKYREGWERVFGDKDEENFDTFEATYNPITGILTGRVVGEFNRTTGFDHAISQY